MYVYTYVRTSQSSHPPLFFLNPPLEYIIYIYKNVYVLCILYICMYMHKYVRMYVHIYVIQLFFFYFYFKRGVLFWFVGFDSMPS